MLHESLFKKGFIKCRDFMLTVPVGCKDSKVYLISTLKMQQLITVIHHVQLVAPALDESESEVRFLVRGHTPGF